MRFATLANGTDQPRDDAARAICRQLEALGHVECAPEDDADFLLNMTSVTRPRAVCRRRQGVHVVSIAALHEPVEDLRTACYSALIRSLANLMVCVVPDPAGNGRPPEAYFTTPEVGFYHQPFEARAVCRSMLPIVSARFAIENEIATDLPRTFWRTSPVLARLVTCGAELDALGVLPTPFPIREVLEERYLHHIERLFGITGMSYGNLSAREAVPGFPASSFWMTARGVDKSRLRGPGQDVFLVTGVDEARGIVHVSAPPDRNPARRVSVDAVEHELIYRTFPGVGAIVHVHAWMEGALCTMQNHPCGTHELATEVVRLLHQAPDPRRAVIGLKNHGLTVTGHDLDDVFSRIRGRLRTEVPMFE
jgi:ribulose-5-phosphate 4-epimerase/fuculose-1-phosphate aldolase